MSDKQRVQFDFSQDAFERIAAMRDKIGAPDLAGVITEALKYYEWVLATTGYNKSKLRDLVFFVNTEFQKKDSE